MQKIITKILLTCTLLIIGATTHYVHADELQCNDKPYDFKSDGFYYKADPRYDDGLHLMVVAINLEMGDTKELIVPAVVTHNNTDYTVTRIAKTSFMGAELLNNRKPITITLPETIKRIDRQAFAICQVQALKFTNPYPPEGFEVFDYDSKKDKKNTILVPQGSLRDYKNDDYWGRLTVKEYQTDNQNRKAKCIIITYDNLLDSKIKHSYAIDFTYQGDRLKMVSGRNISSTIDTFGDNGEAFFFSKQGNKMTINRMVGRYGSYSKMQEYEAQYNGNAGNSCPTLVKLAELNPNTEETMSNTTYQFSEDCLSSYTVKDMIGGTTNTAVETTIKNGLIQKTNTTDTDEAYEITYTYTDDTYAPEGVDVLSYLMSHHSMFEPRAKLWFMPELVAWKKLPSKIMWKALHEVEKGYKTKWTVTFKYKIDSANRLSEIEFIQDERNYKVEVIY